MRSSLALMFLFACGSDPGTVIDAAMMDTGPAPINGCQLAQAVDLTATGASRTITFGATEAYMPRCIKILVGQSVTWNGTFGEHPLGGGIVRSGTLPEAQPGNPVPSVTSGTTRVVTFATAGTWAYYCGAHAPSMAGVVYVQ
jgi:plastocyanin